MPESQLSTPVNQIGTFPTAMSPEAPKKSGIEECASRLEQKENRSPAENRELDLRWNPLAAAFAEKIARLEHNPDRTLSETSDLIHYYLCLLGNISSENKVDVIRDVISELRKTGPRNVFFEDTCKGATHITPDLAFNEISVLPFIFFEEKKQSHATVEAISSNVRNLKSYLTAAIKTKLVLPYIMALIKKTPAMQKTRIDVLLNTDNMKMYIANKVELLQLSILKAMLDGQTPATKEKIDEIIRFVHLNLQSNKLSLNSTDELARNIQLRFFEITRDQNGLSTYVPPTEQLTRN
ncbi:MAG: hypothetical protein A3E82_00050 [Gammaproteobacteria bacterium RIFCSPHIGHO2_12_FULL_38_11]|nr:MAG: hypothetical protein A3E82_00050 [Gammaproteobacteria bacterium RIFCSPHIGHO2_12_FULL_38_11]